MIMATFSLTQPSVGSTAWGSDVNTNFDKIEKAFTGQNTDDIGPFKVNTSSDSYFDGGGNVGIGTSSPDAKLKIEEADPGTTPYLKFLHTAVREWGIYGTGTGDRDLTIKDFSSAVDALTIQAITGNVGIGITSPGDYHDQADNLVISEAGHAGLTVATGTNNAGSIFFADGTTDDEAYRGYFQYDHAGDDLKIGTAGAEQISANSHIL
jgi:hypothetical protein